MRVLDLFSGIGGFSLGLERAGFKTVAFCEIDPFCRRVLAKHWPTVPIFGDVRTLTAAWDVCSQQAESRPERERIGTSGQSIDVICGGFPCQDISVAGKGAGIEGDRSGLWSEYARIIGEVRPRYVIVENVSALLSRGLDRVLGDLAALRYDAEWHCIPASAVGAPHRRDRIWIVAYPSRELLDGSGNAGPLWRHEFADGGQTYPDADSRRREGERIAQHEEQQSASGHEPDGFYEKRWRRRPGDFSAAGMAGRTQQWCSVPIHEELALAQCSDWWSVEPSVGRVADGIPGRVDRLRSLGNAVVPQVVEVIGRAILQREEIQARG